MKQQMIEELASEIDIKVHCVFNFTGEPSEQSVAIATIAVERFWPLVEDMEKIEGCAEKSGARQFGGYLFTILRTAQKALSTLKEQS